MLYELGVSDEDDEEDDKVFETTEEATGEEEEEESKTAQEMQQLSQAVIVEMCQSQREARHNKYKPNI